MNWKIITKVIFLILLIKIFDVSGSVVVTYAKYLLKLTDRSNYTKHVTFVCWSNESDSFESPVGDNLVARGCPFNVPVTLLMPGWQMNYESKTNEILNKTAKSFLKYRGGCVCLADYRAYTLNPNYAGTVGEDFLPISKVIIRKMEEIGNISRMSSWGFSFGARLAVETGATGFNGAIKDVYVLDPAGPGFDGNPKLAQDPKTAGQNVQCFHTSIGVGSSEYVCHQSWRLGVCGWAQWTDPVLSHNFAPIYFNEAFETPYIATESPCAGSNAVNLSRPECKAPRMGFFCNLDKKQCRGNLFVQTSPIAPYV